MSNLYYNLVKVNGYNCFRFTGNLNHNLNKVPTEDELLDAIDPNNFGGEVSIHSDGTFCGVLYTD